MQFKAWIDKRLADRSGTYHTSERVISFILPVSVSDGTLSTTLPTPVAKMLVPSAWVTVLRIPLSLNLFTLSSILRFPDICIVAPESRNHAIPSCELLGARYEKWLMTRETFTEPDSSAHAI